MPACIMWAFKQAMVATWGPYVHLPRLRLGSSMFSSVSYTLLLTHFLPIGSFQPSGPLHHIYNLI